MRKIILLVFVVLLTSCKPYYDSIQEEHNLKIFTDIPLYLGDFEGVETIADITPWIKRHVIWEATKKVLSPEECLKRGKCDCDGFALLWMNIAYIKFGLKYDLILVLDSDTRKIEEGGKFNHAIIVSFDGIQIEPQTGRVENYTIKFSYTFDQVFN